MITKIFIGSSSEGIKYAQALKEKLETNPLFSCTIWTNKKVFKLNDSTLDNLMQGHLFYDFAILVATKDDLIINTKREINTDAPRDNVVLELGMFLGSLGKNRTFLLASKGTKIPSDLNGITLPFFEEDKVKSIDECVEELNNRVREESLQSEFQFLPSTSLALGYFRSFLVPVSRYLVNESLPDRICTVIPNTLSDDVDEQAKLFYVNNDFVEKEYKIPERTRKVQFSKKDNIIYDLPTTLNTIRPIISRFIKTSGIGIKEAQKEIEYKELINFKKTLDNLVVEQPYCNSKVEIVLEDKLKLS